MAADPDLIVRLAARGDGVTGDGRYVARAAPGDRVAADGTIVAGPARAVPPCRHFPECGGCQMQHLTDAAYADWIGWRIVDALARHGVGAGTILPPALSPPRSRRRATLRAVHRDGATLLGFHAEGTHRVVDMTECHVLLPALFALVAPLRALLARRLRAGDGGGVSITATEGGIDLMLSNVRADGPRALGLLAEFAEAHDLARLSVEDEGGIALVALRREPFVRMGGVAVAVPPAPFLQATTEGERALVAAVGAAVGAAGAGAARIADLFAGLGTFALPLAAAGARVHAVDASGPAIAALAAARGRGITTEHRDLFRRPLIATELARYDAVVFDPPRAGAAAQVAEIARAAVPRVVAVSCNPATFARDAAVLAGGGYRLERLWPVGQFRWSSHVELVAEFSR